MNNVVTSQYLFYILGSLCFLLGSVLGLLLHLAGRS